MKYSITDTIPRDSEPRGILDVYVEDSEMFQVRVQEGLSGKKNIYIDVNGVTIVRVSGNNFISES